MILSTTETFDAAHMLSNYDGKCNNLHGHTYKIKVSIRDDVKEDFMVMDFNNLKKVVRHYIDSFYDHALIFSSKGMREKAEDSLLKWAKKYGKKYFEMPYGKSTAECMSHLMATDLKETLHVHSVNVSLWETPNNCCEAYCGA